MREIKQIDERFDEILIKEIPLKISEAFLDLELELKKTFYPCKSSNEKEIKMVKKKANQMKTELNAFIDSQVERITFQSNTQLNSDFPSLEGLEETQSQWKK